MPTNISSLCDVALSELFAVKVAGWKLLTNSLGRNQPQNEFGQWQIDWDFAGRADLVLPWLEKKELYEVIYNANPYTGSVGYWIQVSDAFTQDLKEPRGRGVGNAPTFSRAACIALLAAKGISEVEA